MHDVVGSTDDDDTFGMIIVMGKFIHEVLHPMMWSYNIYILRGCFCLSYSYSCSFSPASFKELCCSNFRVLIRVIRVYDALLVHSGWFYVHMFE